LASVIGDIVESIRPDAEIQILQSAEDAIVGLRHSPATLTFLDTETEDLDGLDHIPEVVQSRRGGHVCVMLGRRDERTLWQLRSSAVIGAIDGGLSDRFAIQHTVHNILTGQRCLCESIRAVWASGPKRFNPHLLSDREDLVLSCLGEGLDNAEAAARLVCSPDTVRTHRTQIMRKLEIHRERELIRYAIAHRYTRFVDNGRVLHPGFERILQKIRRDVAG
jgi:DNA-binding NarL/FixJ family response regulator